MLAKDRIKSIRQILLNYGKADIRNLSDLLTVSEVTIRKDFEKLEAEGFITRTYGGAILNTSSGSKDTNNYECISEIDSKKAIGHIASQIINDNEAIFLGSGSTCLQIAINLKEKKNLTVVTNNITAAIELSGIPSIVVVIIGGNLKSEQYTFSTGGVSALKSFNDIYVRKAFISVDGVKISKGYTTNNQDLAIIYSKLKTYTDELYVVLDSTKFDKIALAHIGDIDFTKRIITDKNIPDMYLDHYFKNDVKVFSTYNLADA